MRSLPLLLLVAACSSLPDPVDRPGTWRATGANDFNLRAMAAEPGHLSRGITPGDSRGEGAARPVARLLAGERAPLADPRTGLRSATQPAAGNAPR